MDDIQLFLLSIVFIIVGVLAMVNYRFWKYDKSDMLSATKFKVFIGGLLLFFIGFCGVITVILEFF